MYESGFSWTLNPADSREGPRWDLMSPAGRVAATVFVHRDYSGHNWFVWDRHGVGGENSCEPTIERAKIAAESAVLRWGKHFHARPAKHRTA
jgi:hypothetical protein